MRIVANGLLALPSGEVAGGHLLLSDAGRIAGIALGELPGDWPWDAERLDASGCYVLPGAIDGHVHFREPGGTHKGDLATESAAAVAGGVTTFFDMPNTQPPTLSLEAVEAKCALAAGRSHANYGFHIGLGNTNLDEILALSGDEVPSVKVFLGSSTGNMRVERREVLERLFRECKHPILVHCEEDTVILRNLEAHRERYGADIPMWSHADIRSAAACHNSSLWALEMARRYGSRLHILHISTALEVAMLRGLRGEEGKRITGEVCPHYLRFNRDSYARFGWRIKCNPSIKDESDRYALVEGLCDGVFHTLGSDHAPHLEREKARRYEESASGLPSVGHALLELLEWVHYGHITLGEAVGLYSGRPAGLFGVKERGALVEGYWGDIVVVEPLVEARASGVSYHCGWTPYAGMRYHHRVRCTLVNGRVAYDGERVSMEAYGMRVAFSR